LPDAMNRVGERFGDARLLEAIGRGRGEPLGDGVADLLGEIAKWRAGERVQDDTSILALELEAVRKPADSDLKVLTRSDAVPRGVEPALH
jgi:hypothetical protein